MPPTDPTLHDHCPCGCWHPQPFVTDTGMRFCGVCYFESNGEEFCLMIPCTPEVCA